MLLPYDLLVAIFGSSLASCILPVIVISDLYCTNMSCINSIMHAPWLSRSFVSAGVSLGPNNTVCSCLLSTDRCSVATMCCFVVLKERGLD